jgi:hypothetical protein
LGVVSACVPAKFTELVEQLAATPWAGKSERSKLVQQNVAAFEGTPFYCIGVRETRSMCPHKVGQQNSSEACRSGENRSKTFLAVDSN